MRTRSTPIVALLALSLAVFCGACGDGAPAAGGKDGKGGPPGKEKQSPPAPVEVVVVETGPISDGLEATATVQARNRAEIRARASGAVSALDVEEGERVTAGQRLARIDQPAYQSLIDKARAQVEKARRDLLAAEQLNSQGVLPKQQVDDAQFNLRQARLELRRLEDERGLGAVTSPIEGVVVSRAVERGEAISAGAALFEVADLAALEIELYVPERHLGRLKPALPVQVSADATGDGVLTGRIERIAPTVDPRSGTVKVTVALGDGTIDQSRRLRPGMYVRARIVLDTRENAVLVPRRAVIYENERAFAYRVEDGAARKLALKIGHADRDRLEVREPIVAGDRVIVFGQRGLEDGAKVRIVGAGAPDAAPNEAGAADEKAGAAAGEKKKTSKTGRPGAADNEGSP